MSLPLPSSAVSGLDGPDSANGTSNSTTTSSLEVNERQGDSRGRGRGRGSGGGQRGGGGGRGRGGLSREVMLSKALSKLLRHQAASAGIVLDKEGFARLDAVMSWPPIRTLTPTVQEIRQITQSNDKQRFTMRHIPSSSLATSTSQAAPTDPANSTDLPEDNTPSSWLIRANQGHSLTGLSSAALHKPLTLEAPEEIPKIVVHGTYFAFWNAIVASGGLKAMGRVHVHCATGVPTASASAAALLQDKSTTTTTTQTEETRGGCRGNTIENGDSLDSAEGKEDEKAVISGMRKDAELLIYINITQTLLDKAMSWWISDNGVILTEGDENGIIPIKYFSRVEGRREGVGVLLLDGEVVAQLPEGVRSRPPLGKGEGGRRGGGGGGGGGRQGRGWGRGKGRDGRDENSEDSYVSKQ